MTAEILYFAKFSGLERAAPERYSMLLVLGLFGGWKSGRLNPAKIVHEIRALEGLASPSLLKPPIQNKYPPLKGLWHKHYLPDGIRSLAINLRKGLVKYGIPRFEKLCKEAQASGEERYMSEEDVNILSNDVVHGNWQRLGDSCERTGEWLLYARHQGQNYYLCLGTHDKSQHEALRRQIDSICCLEFPFLNDLLNKD